MAKGGGKANTKGFIEGASMYPERLCPACSASNFRCRIACRMCAKVFPQSWINDAKAEAGKTSEGAWHNCRQRSASPVATQIAELTKTVSTLAKCVADIQGSRQPSAGADQGGSGSDKAAKDRIAAIQAVEKALAGFMDFGYGKDHPAVAQLERELEQKRREHR